MYLESQVVMPIQYQGKLGSKSTKLTVPLMYNYGIKENELKN